MGWVQNNRRAELATAAVDLLGRHAAGLAVDAVFEGIEREFPLNEMEIVPNRYHGYKPFEEHVLTGMIPLIGAGWVAETDGTWRVTEEGIAARARFSSPGGFYAAAGRGSVKSWLVVHLPQVFAVLSRLRCQYHIEVSTLRRLGSRLILTRMFGRTPGWQRALPIQKAIRYKIPGLRIEDYGKLERYVKSSGLKYNNAGHTLYLPPQSARESAFGGAMKNYPPSAGLKVIKRRGTADAPYLFGDIRNRRISVWYNWITYNRRLLCLVANLFYSRGIGARIYDLIELDCGGYVWSAYVVEHIDGRTPTMAECRAGIDEIKRLETDGLLKLTLTEGYEDEDLTPPGCNNNAFVDAGGQFRYVDFQSFLLVNYGDYLVRLAADTERQATGEGADPKSVACISKGRRLSAFVQDFEMPAMIVALRALLERNGVAVNDRVVLNLDSGDPLIAACLLSEGARWCHHLTSEASDGSVENLLLALGCTRFSFSSLGNGLFPNADCGLPDFLRSSLEGSIVISSSPGTAASAAFLRDTNWSYFISTAPDKMIDDACLQERDTMHYQDAAGQTKSIALFANRRQSRTEETADLALAANSRWAVL